MKEMKELELYIHIPFCIQKCNYCDFLSFSAKPEEMAAYVKALLKQIASKAVVAQKYQVTTIFVGGGTPSILPNKEMEKIFNKLREVFCVINDAEITIEVNPGTTTQEKLRAYYQMGINRLSIGLQSTQDAELKALGRIHTYQEFLDTYEQARKIGFDNINIDLMSEIPGQNVFSWEESLKRVIKLAPEHISAYSLIIEEGTPFYQQYGKESGLSDLPLMPTEDEILAMDEMTKSMLKVHGYLRYEISNYAQIGYECKHNLGYWDRKEYLGLGLGASSYVNQERLKNISGMKEYIEEPERREEKKSLTKQEQMEEFCFLGLRKTKGVRIEDFKTQFGYSLQEIFGAEIEELNQAGLLKIENNRLFLTARGLELGNYVFAKFLH